MRADQRDDIMKRFAFAAAAAFGLFAAACATPEPEPERQTAPIASTPQPQPQTQTSQPTPQPAGPMPGSVQDFEINAGDRVFYGYDQYTLTDPARSTLRRQAAWLSSYSGVRLLLAGHADERGTREYNLALGARRAAAARDYLVSQGVDPARIQTVSYGKERPVCTQSTQECWARNRNATTVIQ
jgi:peptidoglycan-associated lipoprotein